MAYLDDINGDTLVALKRIQEKRRDETLKKCLKINRHKQESQRLTSPRRRENKVQTPLTEGVAKGSTSQTDQIEETDTEDKDNKEK